MFEEIKNIKSGKKELRQFGITVGIILGLLGGLFLLREKAYYYYFFIFSTTFLLSGLITPTLLKPVQKIWMSLAILIGWFVTRIILIAVFYLVITPIKILAKVFGKVFLDLKFNNNKDSYWILKKKVKRERSDYERQF